MAAPAQEGERNLGAALAMLDVLDSTARRWRRAMKWITRERPVIDRIACPWLIARFIDKEPEFLFVPPDQGLRAAAETGAIPYDVPGVEFTHVGERLQLRCVRGEIRSRQRSRHRDDRGHRAGRRYGPRTI